MNGRWAIGMIAGCSAVLALGGCAVAPAYHPPAASAPSRYTSGKPPHKTVAATKGQGGNAQTLQFGEQAAGDWWRSFGSHGLDALVRSAFANSPTLARAQATLRQYQYLARAGAAGYYPSVGAQGSVTRQRSAQQGIFPPQLYNVFAGSLTVSYSPSVFGRTGLTYESAKAQEAQQRYNLQAAYLTLAGNITSTAITAAGYAAQVDATRSIVKDQQQVLQLTERRYQAGAVPYTDVLTQRSQLASTRAQLARLEQQLSQARHSLAALVGKPPASFQGSVPDLSRLTLPGTIPVTLPSRLARSRPDVRAAQAGVRAAHAQYGLAYTDRFPSFNISGSYGQSAPSAGDFLKAPYNIWNAVLGASVKLFDAGRLKNQSEAAKAAFQATEDLWRETLLTAFQQVADGLRALDSDATVLQQRQQQLTAAQQALSITRDQYRQGSASFLDLLTTEVNYSNARVAWIQALTQRYLDTTALYVALGGRAWPDSATTHGSGDQSTDSRSS
ncbi:MAG TPA: efflux transporter outer membrane subunit [Gammaproteobacteria bacterium]|nr:efflux transporter outer membrane subunit [Gammaproteobacteria bacterium]